MEFTTEAIIMYPPIYLSFYRFLTAVFTTCIYLFLHGTVVFESAVGRNFFRHSYLRILMELLTNKTFYADDLMVWISDIGNL